MDTWKAHTRESLIREANHKQKRLGFLSADYQLPVGPPGLILKLVISKEAREGRDFYKQIGVQCLLYRLPTLG